MTAILFSQGRKTAGLRREPNDPRPVVRISSQGIGAMGSSQYSIRQLLLFFIYNKHLGVNDEIA
jgi:hypothetical protein